MNITFCGHRDYFYNSLLEDTLTNILNDFAQKIRRYVALMADMVSLTGWRIDVQEGRSYLSQI